MAKPYRPLGTAFWAEDRLVERPHSRSRSSRLTAGVTSTQNPWVPGGDPSTPETPVLATSNDRGGSLRNGVPFGTQEPPAPESDATLSCAVKHQPSAPRCRPSAHGSS